MKGVLWVVVVSVVVAAWIPLSHCSKKPVGVACSVDIPDINCHVCDKFAKELYHQVRNKKADIEKISEGQIGEIAKNVCNLTQVEAKWISCKHIVKKEDRPELVEQDSEGQCNFECKTIERACQEVIHQYSDVAHYVYNSSKLDINSLDNYLCKNVTEACSTKPPAVPKGYIVWKLQRCFCNDEGKVLSWSQIIKKRVEDTSKTLKKHANKVSNQVRQWWRGKKATNSKKGGKTEL